jgi:hypothetical protein
VVNNDAVKLSMGEAIRTEPAEGQEGLVNVFGEVSAPVMGLYMSVAVGAEKYVFESLV